MGGIRETGGQSEAQRAAARRAAEAQRAAEVQRESAPATRITRQNTDAFEVAKESPVELHRVPSPAMLEATERVSVATDAYVGAREEVSRLNAQLERALRTEPSLRDPEAAERFRTEFQQTHRDAYEAESTTAKALAESLRVAEPLVRADGMTLQNANARIKVLQGLDTLANSSEYRQAAELAGAYGAGADATIPREHTDAVVERAALTGMREDLASGASGEDVLRNAGAVLGLGGLASRTPAISAVGNAIGAGADLSDFMRTGDPASLGAAGFGALGAAAAATAVVSSGPIAIGAAVVSGLSLVGKFVTRQIAGDNEYRAAVQDALAATHNLSREQAGQLMSSDSRLLADAGLSSDELGELARGGHLDDALRVFHEGNNLYTGAYGDNLSHEEVMERAKALETAEPGLPWFAYQERAMTELREERRATQGEPAEQLRSDLVRAGLLQAN